MFELGKLYLFETLLTFDQGTGCTFGGVVLDVALPLIKVRLEGHEETIVILNTSASTFIRAEPSN
jgi:hypothetical protein